MADTVWFNISDGHCKIWGYDAFGSTETGTVETITYWGRIGTPMHKLQKQHKMWPCMADARAYIFAKVEEKEHSHGYSRIANHTYFDALDNKPLSGVLALLERELRKQQKRVA